MKRVGYLFEQAFTLENLYGAYVDASRHKQGTRACFQFARRLGWHLDQLHTELQAGTYRPQPYYAFMVYEPKPRRIYAPAFRDLVVQHAIYRVVYPLFNRTFIDQSFACRRGKGTHAAADYAQAALQASPRDRVTLKLDIRKFFSRIDRAVLRARIERKVKDRRFVDVLMQFADHGEPTGIPIGNLLSQLYALIYLNGLDHWLTREQQVPGYCRYVDDFLVFGLSRAEARVLLARVVTYLGVIGLELSRATIAPVSRGVNFVGFRTWASKRFIRKRSLFVFSRALRAHRRDAAQSVLGHARRTHSARHLTVAFKEAFPS